MPERVDGLLCLTAGVRVLIVTSGSMGDVAPYTGLGARLRDAGHQVTLATHEPFRDAVELPFLPIPGDLREILPQARGQDGATSGTGPRALARLLRIARPLVATLGDGIEAAVSAVRPEAILLSTVVAPLGYQIAEAHGVPWAGVFPQPIHPTREFGSVLVGGRSFGPWGNLALGHLVALSARPLYAGPVRDLRRRLGLPAASMRTLQAAQELRHPTFHGFSTAVVPRPADWPAALRITGYWWPARPAGWQPPPALTDFLAAGPPPVFIGFGSMAPGHGERLAALVLDAVRRAGVRAILQAGWSGLSTGSAHDDGLSTGSARNDGLSTGSARNDGLSTGSARDDVLSIGELPHDWLFPRTAAVVHHAGAGTTAAGLRAGVPAVAVPVLADQPFWARRLHTLGVTPAPIPMPALTPGRLAVALRAVTTDPHYAARSQAVSARIRAEDGAAPILAWLSTLP
ncbi:glycosyltransferase [Micromonosporaceae bacterium Da 78-11]